VKIQAGTTCISFPGEHALIGVTGFFVREVQLLAGTPVAVQFCRGRDEVSVVGTASWQRHKQNQSALIAGLQALGLELFVPNPSDRLPTLTSVNVPLANTLLRSDDSECVTNEARKSPPVENAC
jgi:hypothetical protein